MGIDDTVNLERIASALEKIGNALEILTGNHVKVERERRAAEIHRPEQEKREQFSDKASAEWFKETEQATSTSRFQQRRDQQTSTQKGSGTKPVH